MSHRGDDLALAMAEAAAARKRLNDTAAALQARLRPARLACDVCDRATEASATTARAAVVGMKNHPSAVIASAVLASLVLSRHAIVRIFRRLKR